MNVDRLVEIKFKRKEKHALTRINAHSTILSINYFMLFNGHIYLQHAVNFNSKFKFH